MSEKIKLTIPPAVAVYVRPGSSVETRLAGCAAAAGLPPYERVLLLFCLSRDTEMMVKTAAVKELKMLPEEVIADYAGSTNVHPAVLETLSRLTLTRPVDPDIADGQSELLALSDPPEEDECSKQSDTTDEKSEEFLSKYKAAQMMGIGEKIKMALTGDKEWRAILVKEANKLVSGSVIKNPRITEAEVHALIKSGIQNDEIMRLICANKEWIKSYKIRVALIANNRTPLQNAMRYLDTMGEKDLAAFAKSKNVSSVISTMAKRLLLNRKR